MVCDGEAADAHPKPQITQYYPCPDNVILYQSKAHMRRPIMVITTNLHPVSRRFQVIAASQTTNRLLVRFLLTTRAKVNDDVITPAVMVRRNLLD